MVYIVSLYIYPQFSFITSNTLLLPSVWTPRTLLEQRFELANTVPELLKAIYKEKKSLREIHWKNLEEIVAELLRSRGFEISVMPFTRDGGRDIVARGEFIPGEPTVLAIEVKQKEVVGIQDVRLALKAKEDFPALLIATSGRFSAGVVNEGARNRNQLRLFIKDGIALSQWIEAYGIQKRWRKSN